MDVIKESGGVSSDVARFIHNMINGKYDSLYTEAEPSKCQVMKESGVLTHIDWDSNKCMLTSNNMDMLSEECGKIGAKATLGENGVKILIPIFEATPEDFGVDDAQTAGVADEHEVPREDYATKKDVEDMRNSIEEKLNEFFAEKDFITKKELELALGELRIRS